VTLYAVGGSIIPFIRSDTGSLKDRSLYVASSGIRLSIIVFTWNPVLSLIKIFIVPGSLFSY
jgi:hypothetical protein